MADLGLDTCISVMSMTRHLEDQAAALGPGGVIVSAFQSAGHFGPQTRRRYEALAADAALVAAVGVGMDANPAAGVRGASLATNDPLQHEWNVLVIGPHFAAALLARERAGVGPDRVFDYVLSYARDVVLDVASLLAVRVTDEPVGLPFPERWVSSAPAPSPRAAPLVEAPRSVLP